jgi:predicted lipid-binding transport protein (Tim44 family)
MKKLIAAVFVAIIATGISINDADAKRLGGGKSFGTQRQSTTTSSPSASPSAATPSAAKPAPAAAPAPTPAPQSGMSKWLGPLAGLAAGGLLASMFMGSGLGGAMMNILMIVALVVGVMFVIRMLRSRNSGGQQPQTVPAQPVYYAPTPAADAPVTPAPAATGMLREIRIGSALGGGTAESAAMETVSTRPDWFEDEPFLREARGHFMRLQAANDAGDTNDIREYTTPEVFAEIALQIQERGNQPQTTEVVSLHANMIEVVTENDTVIASVRFYGLIREEAGAQPVPFDEAWHIQKPLNQAGAVWRIAGIQQLQ